MLKLRKEEQNVRDTVRKNFLRRGIEYIKSIFNRSDPTSDKWLWVCSIFF